MQKYSDNEWHTDSGSVYTSDEVESVLRQLGIQVVEETVNDFVSLCPYHGNTDTPAFSTSKTYGYSVCFNPSCAVGTDRRLTLVDLVMNQKGLSRIAAKRFVLNARDYSDEALRKKFESQAEPEDIEFSSVAIENMKNRLWSTPRAIEYLKSRGFEEETIDHFNIGFTPKSISPMYREWDMVATPAYNDKSMPVGIVCRAIESKVFKNYGPLANGRGFHKSHIVFNLNEARKHSSSLILVESTFDAMRIWQAGYKNVGALLGGSLSTIQKSLIMRNFSDIIIMTDNESDENGQRDYIPQCKRCLRLKNPMCQGHSAGRELGMKISKELSSLGVSWAVWDNRQVYPHHAKDATDLTEIEIIRCLRNAIPHFDYVDYYPTW